MTMTAEERRAERLGRLVPMIVGALLVGIIALNAVVYRLASADGVNIEPNYYAQALAWDSTAALEARSAALGWQADARFLGSGDGGALRVTVRDRAGAPVRGATVAVRVRHNSDAMHATRVMLAPEGDAYVATIGRLRPGLHEVQVTAIRADAVFRAVLRRDATATEVAHRP